MKRCKNIKCGKILPNSIGVGRPPEYCENCQQRFKHINWNNTYRMKHDKARVGNPRQDADNNWVISDTEINGCTNPELQWIKNLELSIYNPKIIINPFI